MLLVTSLAILCCFLLTDAKVTLKGTPKSRKLVDGNKSHFDLKLSGVPDGRQEAAILKVLLKPLDSDVIDVQKYVKVYSWKETMLHFNSTNPGSVEIHFETVENETVSISDLDQTYLHINVIKNHGLDIFNDIIGWVYFFAWSISFYPQVFYNFRRWSVIGLNFDFLAYNILGFGVYSAYNVGLYWLKPIKDQYRNQHPGQLIPVQLNDVIFSLHAFAISLFTATQCIYMKRGTQRVSYYCWGFYVISFAYIFVMAMLVVADGTSFIWLKFLYWIAYIKLVISFIKYIPQAYMNYKRKSTVGWSIGNIILDCTGGTLSILQSVLISYNSDDWHSLYGDPVKFGLGFFSVAFDIFFMIQHYILYRNNRYDEHAKGGLFHRSYKILDEDAVSPSEEMFNPLNNINERNPTA